MATVITRHIRSTPLRTSIETWDFICNLIAEEAGSAARRELNGIDGVAGQIISSEVPKNSSLVVFGGGGPRVRIYCLYDEDAIGGDDANENRLASSPTTGSWKMSLSASADDIDWVKAELQARAPHISVRLAGTQDPGEEALEKHSTSVTVNLDEFLK
jgi:hypothetical protein